LFERLECRDYARFDWRLDARGNPKLLEANPNPGWCWDGHLAKMAGLAGLSYADMLTAILAAAERRLGLTSRTGSRLENRIDVKLAAG
jgi:D-alanine-D-alanine ligase